MAKIRARGRHEVMPQLVMVQDFTDYEGTPSKRWLSFKFMSDGAILKNHKVRTDKGWYHNYGWTIASKDKSADMVIMRSALRDVYRKKGFTEV